jgi:hypothetical protein
MALAVVLVTGPAQAELIRTPPPKDATGFLMTLRGMQVYSSLSPSDQDFALRSAAAFFAAMYCRLPDPKRTRAQFSWRPEISERTGKMSPVGEAYMAALGMFLEVAHGYHRNKRSCGLAAEISEMPIDSLPD